VSEKTQRRKWPWLTDDQFARVSEISPAHLDYWRYRWRAEHGHAFDEPPEGWAEP